MVIFARLVDSLKRDERMHFLLRLQLFFMRVDDRMQRSYNYLIESISDKAKTYGNTTQQISTELFRLAVRDQHARDGSLFSRATLPSLETQVTRRETLNETSGEPTEAASAWDWLGFPEPLPGTRCYNCISNSWMVYVVVRTLFRDQLVRLADLTLGPLLNMRGNCLLMGRIVFHQAISEMSIMLFPLYHLSWRLKQALADKHFKLTMFNFLMHSDADIERFHQIFDDEQELKLARIGQSSTGTRRRHGSESPKPLVGCALEINKRYIRHAMCYQVHDGERVYIRLRPNRTPEARSQLFEQIARSFIIITVVFIIIIAIGASYIALVLLSDRLYVATYPGCFEELDDLVAKNELPFLSITLEGHHLFSFIIDCIENAIVWVDCVTAMLYGPTFCYLLNYDLLLYWSSLQARLESLLIRVRRKNLSTSHFAAKWWSIELSSKTRRRYLGQTSRPDKDQLELESEINELQFEVFDFFREVGRVDVLVSDVLTHSIIIWLSCCLMIGINFHVNSHGVSSIPFVVKCLLSIGFTVVITASHFLLTLRRRCLRTYKSLCSLMANYQGNEKKELLKLMDFFNQQNRITYTLAHHFPYQPTTFITILGYTVSCFLIAINFVTRNKRNKNEVVWPENTTFRPDWAGSNTVVGRLLQELAIN